MRRKMIFSAAAACGLIGASAVASFAAAAADSPGGVLDQMLKAVNASDGKGDFPVDSIVKEITTSDGRVKAMMASPSDAELQTAPPGPTGTCEGQDVNCTTRLTTITGVTASLQQVAGNVINARNRSNDAQGNLNDVKAALPDDHTAIIAVAKANAAYAKLVQSAQSAGGLDTSGLTIDPKGFGTGDKPASGEIKQLATKAAGDDGNGGDIQTASGKVDDYNKAKANTQCDPTCQQNAITAANGALQTAHSDVNKMRDAAAAELGYLKGLVGKAVESSKGAQSTAATASPTVGKACSDLMSLSTQSNLNDSTFIAMRQWSSKLARVLGCIDTVPNGCWADTGSCNGGIDSAAAAQK